MPGTKKLVTIALSSILLAACGGSASVSTSSAPAGSPPASAPKPAASAAASAAPASAKPAASVSAAASAKPAASAGTAPTGSIKIGVIGPMTGSDSINGTEHRDGVDLYLASINGTIAGRKIEPEYLDAQGKADVALAKAKQAVEGDHVQMLMCVSTTPVGYAVAQYAKEAQVPFAASINCGAQYLTTDPKFANPLLTRLTQTASANIDAAADWAYKNGHRKIDLMSSDYGGGIETSDAFASAFILRGGSVVQEQHPAMGSTDYGPFLAQLNQDADLMVFFGAGADSLHFADQYSSYASKKLPILDLYGQITNGPNIATLKDKVVGITSAYVYTEAFDGADNQAFLKNFHAKFPGRLTSGQLAQGYGNMEVVAAAIKAANGNIEDKTAFANALHNVSTDTIKGPVKLDQFNNVVQNTYLFQMVKDGNTYGQKLLDTYKDTGQFWDRTQQQIDQLKLGTHKGQWVGMTKDKVTALQGS
jgi:branched-chain amino acid transport system substrate-binding protein